MNRYTYRRSRERYTRISRAWTIALAIAALIWLLLFPMHELAPMTFTGKLYGKVMLTIWNKELDFDTDTITVVLTTSTHTPDQDAHDYLNDLTNEVSGGGYSRQTLASKTTTYTGATNKHVLDAADTTFTSFSATFRNVHLVDTSPATDATRPLIGYEANDADIVGGGGDLTLVWNASGIVETTVA